MRIAIAQITTDPGRIEQNLEKILREIKRAEAQNASLLVFPELALTGYGCMDLFYRGDLIKRTNEAIVKIRENTGEMAVILGHPSHEEGELRAGGRPALRNVATIFHQGKIVGSQAKRLLPNYEIFSEERYFVPGEASEIFELLGKKIGLQVCEDLWDGDYEEKISRDLISKGAEIIFNLSASPFEPGKYLARENLIREVYKTCGFTGVFVYANLIGSFDGFEGEVVFDGRSTVFNGRGKLVAVGKGFEEDFIVVDCDQIEGDKKDLKVASAEDPIEETFDALILGIQEFFRRLGVKNAYIGLSGGIDSAVVAALSVHALGASHVRGVTMPSQITSADTKLDALLVAHRLNIKCEERPILAEFEAWKAEFLKANGKEPSGLTMQNKQARIRGTIMMEYANEDPSGIVLTTGNKTELATGYCTLYGDMCGALAVLGDVSKANVYALARFMNKRAGNEIIPVTTIDRVPTAELAPGQVDRDNLPADYPVLSPLVELVVETGAGVDELVERGFERKVVETTVKLVNRNEFKRRQAAPAIRVTGHAFGVGRRVPMG